ncbi:excinuclease ABC subunit C [Actinobacillus equuli]|nr:excinuclease ABC subunit C [Actinobacillus equuli]
MAKGVERKAGLETLLISKWDKEIHLPPDSPALHLIQHIRDESHNHAISGHRKNAKKLLRRVDWSQLPEWEQNVAKRY